MTIPIIALSDAIPAETPSKETRDSFTQDLKEFMTYLAFWQDTVNRCKSQEVEDTLLDHFQVLFVQQLLYPSLLESSDVTGGSTAAVIAHLARILLALEPQRPADVDHCTVDRLLLRNDGPVRAGGRFRRLDPRLDRKDGAAGEVEDVAEIDEAVVEEACGV